MTLVRTLFLSILTATLSFAADVSGKWQAEVTTPNGSMQLTYQLKAEGETLTGTMASQMGEMPIKEGKVNGDNLSWVVTWENDGNTIRIVHKATVSGSEMKVTSTIEGRDRTFEYTAKKQS